VDPVDVTWIDEDMEESFHPIIEPTASRGGSFHRQRASVRPATYSPMMELSVDAG
jgi:hypothetical protein